MSDSTAGGIKVDAAGRPAGLHTRIATFQNSNTLFQCGTRVIIIIIIIIIVTINPECVRIKRTERVAFKALARPAVRAAVTFQTCWAAIS